MYIKQIYKLCHAYCYLNLEMNIKNLFRNLYFFLFDFFSPFYIFPLKRILLIELKSALWNLVYISLKWKKKKIVWFVSKLKLRYQFLTFSSSSFLFSSKLQLECTKFRHFYLILLLVWMSSLMFHIVLSFKALNFNIPGQH